MPPQHDCCDEEFRGRLRHRWHTDFRAVAFLLFHSVGMHAGKAINCFYIQCMCIRVCVYIIVHGACCVSLIIVCYSEKEDLNRGHAFLAELLYR